MYDAKFDHEEAAFALEDGYGRFWVKITRADPQARRPRRFTRINVGLMTSDDAIPRIVVDAIADALIRVGAKSEE